MNDKENILNNLRLESVELGLKHTALESNNIKDNIELCSLRDKYKLLSKIYYEQYEKEMITYFTSNAFDLLTKLNLLFGYKVTINFSNTPGNYYYTGFYNFPHNYYGSKYDPLSDKVQFTFTKIMKNGITPFKKIGTLSLSREEMSRVVVIDRERTKKVNDLIRSNMDKFELDHLFRGR